MTNRILEIPITFHCRHCGCESSIKVIYKADDYVKSRYKEGVELFMKYAGRQDPTCLLQARLAEKILDGNEYENYILCPICFNRTKFNFGEG
jgi:hypothetical protein